MTDPIVSLDDSAPKSATPASCCAGKSWLMTPMLLIAAATLGFAGQQLYQSGGDFQQLLGVSAGSSGGCPLSAAAPSGGCCATQMQTASTGGCCAMSQGQATTAACCAAAQAAIVAESSESAESTDAPVSAVAIENATSL